MVAIAAVFRFPLKKVKNTFASRRNTRRFPLPDFLYLFSKHLEMPRNKKLIELTKCEAEVMDVVWDKESVTVNDVVETIERDLAYTTVLTTMKILEDKKIVRRGKKIGRAFTYTAKVSREQVREGMLKSLADQLFGGSTRSLVLSLLQSDAVSAADIEAVRNAADKLGDS